MRFEARLRGDDADPAAQQPGDRGEHVGRRVDDLERAGDGLGGHRRVAEVGDEAPDLGADHGQAAAAAEAGQPGDVGHLVAAGVAGADEVADDHRLEARLRDRCSEPLGAALGHAHTPELPSEHLQALAIALDPLAGDLRGDEPVEDGDRPPVVAVVDVADVDLDRRLAGDLERVADRPRVVRPRPGVDEDGVGGPGDAVQVLAELALVVGLEEGGLEIELAGVAVDPVLELGERLGPVDLGVAAPERVEVDAVHHRHPVVGTAHPLISVDHAAEAIGLDPLPEAHRSGLGDGHEADPLGRLLLVAADRVEDGVGLDPRVDHDRQPGALEQGGDLGLELSGAGETERRDEADRYRLAVAIAAVAARRLDRVADGVAEVEHRAQPRVVLVGGDDVELRPRAVEDERGDRRGVDRVERPDPVPERAAGDQRRLHDLGEAGRQLGGGKRGERGGVGQHGGGLVEGADVVLGLGQVHAGLAAVGGVDLGDEGRRHLDDRDAALVDGGAEADEVAGDAAAEGAERVVAADAGAGELAEQRVGGGEALRLLAAGDLDRPARPRRPGSARRRPRAHRGRRGRTGGFPVAGRRAPRRAASSPPVRPAPGRSPDRDRDQNMRTPGAPRSRSSHGAAAAPVRSPPSGRTTRAHSS